MISLFLFLSTLHAVRNTQQHNPETSGGILKTGGISVVQMLTFLEEPAYFCIFAPLILQTGRLFYLRMCHTAASETQKCVQVFSFPEPCDKPPHAFPSYTSLSLQPFSSDLAVQLDLGEFPVQTKPAPPSPIPPSPALLQMLSPPMLSHHRARCVQLPLAGINTRYPQL